MPKASSADIRGRVIASVQSGASRREAAEQFEVSPSAAIKWLQQWKTTGRSTAKARGGSTSPLEEYKDWLLQLVKLKPDSTLDEVVAAMRERGIGAGSRTAVWRFFDRHMITFKKKPARGGATSAGRRTRTPAVAKRATQA